MSKIKMSKFSAVFLALLWSLVFMTGCMLSDWQTIHPPNCAGSFDLPKPVEEPVVSGQKLYISRQGKIEMFVGVYDPVSTGLAPDAPAADQLRKLEEARLGGEQGFVQKLKDQGMNPQLIFEKDLKTDRAIGQQIRIQVGEQFILTQSWVAPDALYFFKIDNGDASNEMVAKVLDSIKP
jgi:hypothetical protein